jgi:adenylate kinase family enzyme
LSFVLRLPSAGTSDIEECLAVQRVAIIGVSGSGKSWLAVRLGRVLGLPVYHLDRLAWRPGWQRVPGDEWRALQVALVREPAWIIDGNFGTLDLRLSACDTVVWLDLPTWVCLWGVVWRYLSYRGRVRPDMSAGCPERLDGKFLRWVVAYRKRRRPRVLRALWELPSSTRVVHLASRREIARWLNRQRAKAVEG